MRVVVVGVVVVKASINGCDGSEGMTTTHAVM